MNIKITIIDGEVMFKQKWLNKFNLKQIRLSPREKIRLLPSLGNTLISQGLSYLLEKAYFFEIRGMSTKE